MELHPEDMAESKSSTEIFLAGIIT
jgi:hypothetical protein